MCEVGVGARGVWDDVEVISRGLRHNEIVDDTALVVGEERQSALVLGEWCHVADHQAVHELDLVAAGYLRLHHVGYVEQRHVLPTDNQHTGQLSCHSPVGGPPADHQADHEVEPVRAYDQCTQHVWSDL